MQAGSFNSPRHAGTIYKHTIAYRFGHTDSRCLLLANETWHAQSLRSRKKLSWTPDPLFCVSSLYSCSTGIPLQWPVRVLSSLSVLALSLYLYILVSFMNISVWLDYADCWDGTMCFSSTEDCRYRSNPLPLCVDAWCKTQCWLEGAVVNARVTESKCVGSGAKASCYCRFCKKDWPPSEYEHRSLRGVSWLLSKRDSVQLKTTCFFYNYTSVLLSF
jgi:hypothetical protein